MPDDADWVQEIIEWLNNEGEFPLVLENVDLNKLPDVYVIDDGLTKKGCGGNE